MSHPYRKYIHKGYESQGLVPEVYHSVAADQGIHEADHVMTALGTLLSRHLIGYDVQPTIHLRKRERERENQSDVKIDKAEKLSMKCASETNRTAINAKQCRVRNSSQ